MDHKPAESMESCGFDKLFYGSGQCSGLSLTCIVGRLSFIVALKECSGFNSSFEEVCRKCVHAITSARDDIMELYHVKGDRTEEMVCEVAILIAIAGAKLDKPELVSEFERCVPALDNRGSEDYIRIKSSTVRSVSAVFLPTVATWAALKLITHLRQKKPAKCIQRKFIDACSGLYRFSKAEIENAINIDNKKVCLGRGSAGHIYKGILPSGQEVAIKHIMQKLSSTFKREVEGLSRVRHPSLVCLFGCCVEDGEHYLVYEYCPGGNLAQHLQREDAVLTWETRVKILRDCSVALRYLHHYIDGCIVHRDIKLTNILLTDKMEAKLSDFGLARMLEMEETRVFTEVRGTIGYMDPEYVTNAKLTCSSDIYSFGIVMLQLLSGKKVLELDLDARNQLTRIARDVSMELRPLSDFEDPRLNGNINRIDFQALLLMAVLCIAKSSKDRPTIDEVCEETERVWKRSSGALDTSQPSTAACIKLQNLRAKSTSYMR
ncbi:hypothetical protein MLD38_018587 [Melastoma candidum]|uniref:Uncharacterized protein n=1 Tax=Melastoma candidum TaxID=119954 RepID=A0ACB9QVL9_9MYRT|nr:hypothetical protein MLD38_018587 [Melastoma candidum]